MRARMPYAACNHYGGPRAIRVWPFNGHEGGETDQHLEALDFLDGVLAGKAPSADLPSRAA